MTEFSDPKKYYQVLGADFYDDNETIKIKYREKAKFWHPDHNPDPQAMENFQKVSVAYEVLKNEDSRMQYNLLSLVYNENNFPDMATITPFLNSQKRLDGTIRSVSVKQVCGQIFRTRSTVNTDILTFEEAKKALFMGSLKNWLLGWWGIKGIFQTPKVIVENSNVFDSNRENNLRLFVHNMVALAKENKDNYAAALAALAQKYAKSDFEKNLLKEFMKRIGFEDMKTPADWNYKKLKLVQFIVPAIMGLLVFISLNNVIFSQKFFQQIHKEINYSHKVKGMEGKTTFDDVIVGKIMSIPVDVNDMEMLYHLKSDADIMVGPSNDFDVLVRLKKGHTVRITGYTPDQVWYRLMLDNGENGFLRGKYLAKGIENQIPENSKIYEKP